MYVFFIFLFRFSFLLEALEMFNFSSTIYEPSNNWHILYWVPVINIVRWILINYCRNIVFTIRFNQTNKITRISYDNTIFVTSFIVLLIYHLDIIKCVIVNLKHYNTAQNYYLNSVLFFFCYLIKLDYK